MADPSAQEKESSNSASTESSSQSSISQDKIDSDSKAQPETNGERHPIFNIPANNDGIGDFNLFNRDEVPNHPPAVLDNDIPPEEEPTMTKEQRQRTNFYERQDIMSSLEHIIAIGAHNRQKQWRQETYLKQETHPPTPAAANPPNATDNQSPSASKEDENPRKRAHYLHAQDVRVYGLSEGFPGKKIFCVSL